jgi:ubiquinone/menaquinone biosynthesis C-methylase UbiE
MDDAAADPADLRRSLAYIRKINTLLGYTRATLGHLERFSRGWSPGQTIRFLDVATGSADIPRAILRWAGRRGFDVRIVAVDLHATTLKLAAVGERPTPSPGTPGEGRGEGSGPLSPPRERVRARGEHEASSGKAMPSDVSHFPLTPALSRGGEREDAGLRNGPRGALDFVQADALHLPFADGSFDYALTAMFLHHLDDDAAVTVLREMARVARRGIVAADLLRHRRAYAWITLLTLLAGPMVKHDARASVAQAFTKREVLALREAAGIPFARYYRHFGHRFALAGEW